MNIAQAALLLRASRQHFGRDGLGFAKRLQPFSLRDRRDRHQAGQPFRCNKKEIETDGIVNESKVTVKCFLIRI
jgi:hypothetical protein